MIGRIKRVFDRGLTVTSPLSNVMGFIGSIAVLSPSIKYAIGYRMEHTWMFVLIGLALWLAITYVIGIWRSDPSDSQSWRTKAEFYHALSVKLERELADANLLIKIMKNPQGVRAAFVHKPGDSL